MSGKGGEEKGGRRKEKGGRRKEKGERRTVGECSLAKWSNASRIGGEGR